MVVCQMLIQLPLSLCGIEIDISKDVPKKGRYNRPFDGHGDQESGLGLFLDYERMVVKEDAPRLDSVSAGLTYDF